MKINNKLTFERASELFTYDSNTGIIRWKDKRKDVLSKFQAGCVDSGGYIRLRVDCIDYQAHRVAWLLANGNWPCDFIDHINQSKTDNRICNLRDVTHKLNSENVGQKRKKWRMGTRLHIKSGLWQSTIVNNYKSISLGYFKTEEEGQQAYLRKKRELHTAFTG